MPEFSNHVISLFKKRAAAEQVSSVGLPYLEVNTGYPDFLVRIGLGFYLGRTVERR